MEIYAFPSAIKGLLIKDVHCTGANNGTSEPTRLG
jgi:hypothetical protein